MPSQIALLLCIAFVLFSLRLDNKKETKVSGVLWIPTIFMIYISSRPLALWFGISGDPNEGSPLDRNFQIILMLIGLILLFRRNFNWSYAVNNNISLFLLLGFMFVSILWSNMPFVSFKRWTRELIAVVMAFLVLSERNPRVAVEKIFRRLIYISIPFSLLLIKYFPEYGINYDRHDGMSMWIGITTHKQALGELCLISMFILIWTLIGRRKGLHIHSVKYQKLVEAILLIMTGWLLIAGGKGKTSATATGAMVFGIAVFICLQWYYNRGIYIGLIALTAIVTLLMSVGIMTTITGGTNLELIASALGRDKTLTGRSDIWATILPLAMNHPIFGAGFGGFWTYSMIDELQVSEMHNGYLEVILELGFVGILLVWFFLVSNCRKALKKLHDDYYWASLWICFLLMTLLANFTESSLNSLTSPLMTVLLFLSVSYEAPASYAVGDSRGL